MSKDGSPEGPDAAAHGTAHGSQESARTYFPRGLAQPAKRFRFSIDALLLAAFADPPRRAAVTDLGCGCGVIGLGMLLRRPDLQVLGLDLDPEMIAASQHNAEQLGLGHRYDALQADMKHVRDFMRTARRVETDENEAVGIKTGATMSRGAAGRLGPESMNMVVLNPPYRRESQGRLPEPDRARALFEGSGSLDDFLDAAFFLTRNRGRVAMIYGADRTAELLCTLSSHRLEPKRLRFVHGRLGDAARLVLVETVKNSAPGMVVEPPVILYENEIKTRSCTETASPSPSLSPSPPTPQTLTAQALEFCPFLVCNSGLDVPEDSLKA